MVLIWISPRASSPFGSHAIFILGEHMGILFAHARDEWNILISTPLLGFERAPVGFQTGDLRCDKDLVKKDERL